MSEVPVHKHRIASQRPLETLAANVTRFRTEKGFSADDLYLRSGVTASVIEAIERAEVNVSLHQLEMVAKALGVTEVQLLKPCEIPIEGATRP